MMREYMSAGVGYVIFLIRRLASKRKALPPRLFNVGPPSATLAQH